MKISLLVIVLVLSILLLWTDPIEGRGGRGGRGRGRGSSGRGRGTSGGSGFILGGSSFRSNSSNSNSTLHGGEITGIVLCVLLGPVGIALLGIVIWQYCFPKWQKYKCKLKRKWKNTRNWFKSKFCCRIRLTQETTTTTTDIKLQVADMESDQVPEEAPPSYNNYTV